MSDRLSPEVVKTATDAYLRHVFAKHKHMAEEVGPSYVDFWERIDQVAMAGGKRIRAYLTMVGYGAMSPDVIPIAAAQECFHAAILMHDDVIDQDFMRRGSKNINGLYLDVYDAYLDHPRAVHYANSAGILAGDALLSEAYGLIGSSQYDEQLKTRLVAQLYTSVYEVIGGELIDVEAAFVHDRAIDPMKIYRYKTTGYSFIGPLLSGAYCSGADQETIDSLRRYALSVGIAFQIQDDILGIYGDERITGKSTLTDLREAKQTLMVLFHHKLMDATMAKRFDAFGRVDTSDEQLHAIKEDMAKSGAKQQVIETAEAYFTKAEQELDAMDHSERRDALIDFTARLRGRSF